MPRAIFEPCLSPVLPRKKLDGRTRMRDTAFKRVLKTMLLGSELRIDGPLGSFTLHSNASRPANARRMVGPARKEGVEISSLLAIRRKRDDIPFQAN